MNKIRSFIACNLAALLINCASVNQEKQESNIEIRTKEDSIQQLTPYVDSIKAYLSKIDPNSTLKQNRPYWDSIGVYIKKIGPTYYHNLVLPLLLSHIGVSKIRIRTKDPNDPPQKIHPKDMWRLPPMPSYAEIKKALGDSIDFTPSDSARVISDTLDARLYYTLRVFRNNAGEDSIVPVRDKIIFEYTRDGKRIKGYEVGSDTTLYSQNGKDFVNRYRSLIETIEADYRNPKRRVFSMPKGQYYLEEKYSAKPDSRLFRLVKE